MSPKLSLEQTLEAVLFVASEPVSLSQLADITGQPQSKVKAALTALSDSLNDHGIRLIQHQEQYTLVTHPAASEQVEQFLGSQTRAELTKPALETLAIIAYRQPVTKAAIESIRGVSSDQTLRTLLARGLITENRQETETVYSTTIRFLQHFGLSDHRQLPPLPDPANHQST